MGKRTLVGLLGFMTGAALFLWNDHQEHILSVLPYAIFLLCPILHLFMHRRHGGHGGHESHGSGGATPGSHRIGQGEGGE